MKIVKEMPPTSLLYDAFASCVSTSQVVYRVYLAVTKSALGMSKYKRSRYRMTWH
jgi:hypothetical protein